MTKARKSPNRPATVATISALTRWCGVSPRTAASWKTQRSFPVEDDGSYAPFKVAQWHTTRSLTPPAPTDDAMSGPSSPMLERWREERFLMAKLDRLARQPELIHRASVHAHLSDIAGLIRGCGEQLQQQFGPEALSILDGALEEVAARIKQWFSVSATTQAESMDGDE